MSKLFWSLAMVFILVSPLILRVFSQAHEVDVEVDRVTSRVIRDSVLSSGNLIYNEEAQLSPEIIARVTSVQVVEGDKVEKGQPLIYLEDLDLKEVIFLQQAQVAIDIENVDRQQINVKNLQARFERIARLLDKGIITRENYDDAYYQQKAAKSDLEASKLNVKRSKAALKQAEQRLRQTVIKAPMSGTVVAVSIKPGETAVPSTTGIPGSSLITIANEASIVVDLNVDENDIGNLSINGEAYISCPTLPEGGLKGQINEIAIAPRNASQAFAANDATGRSYSVKVALLENRPEKLRSGMSCRAKIYTNNPDPALTVPVQAIMSERLTDDDGVSLPRGQRSKGKKYVFVASNGQTEKRTVITGAADDEYQEVKLGLKANEKIVIGPSRILSSLQDETPIVEIQSQGESYALLN